MEPVIRINANKSKGQTTIEFLMIFLMILTFVELVVNPTLRSAGDAALDAKNAAQAAFSAHRLANTIAETSIYGDTGKESMVLFLPDKTSFQCDKDGSYKCEDGEMRDTCAGASSCNFPKILFQMNTESENIKQSSQVSGCVDALGDPAGSCCGFVPINFSRQITAFKCEGSAEFVDGSVSPKVKFEITRSGGDLIVTRKE
jgi:hypothetical protein